MALSLSMHKLLVCLLYAVNGNDSNSICLVRKDIVTKSEW